MPRHLPRAVTTCLLALGLAIAGCSRGDGGTATPPPLGDGDVAEWRGTLPCADCQGIDTRLVLERRDGVQSYRLVEVYAAVDGSQSFDESGEWTLERQLLSLAPGTGGLRRYAVVGGGALQVRAPDGRVFPGREHDLLLPAGGPP